MSHVPFNSILKESLLHKFLFGYENFSQYLYRSKLMVIRVSYIKRHVAYLANVIFSVVMNMSDWLHVLYNHGNMLVFRFNQAGPTKPNRNKN